MQDSVRPIWFSRLTLLGALAFAAIAPANAAPTVVASLTQPPGGLACSEAADQAHVVFDFKEPRSDLKQFSVFVDGKGLPEDAISEEWPRVTVLKGLHEGRNKVEIYATGADGKTEAHTLTVLVGEAPKREDKEDVAIVDCVGRGGERVADRDRATKAGDAGKEIVAQASDDSEEVIEDVRPHVDEDVDEADRVVYEDAPVYVYHPYPVFGFVSFYPVYYYPWPYYYAYYGYPAYPRYYYGGRYYYGHGGYYRGGPRYSAGAGAYWRGFNRGPGPSRAPMHASPSGRGGGGRGRH